MSEGDLTGVYLCKANNNKKDKTICEFIITLNKSMPAGKKQFRKCYGKVTH